MTGGETDIAVAAIASGGAFLTALATAAQAFRKLALRRQIDSSKRFVDLVSRLNNTTGTGDVGMGAQILAAWLIAEFGRHNRFLRKAAKETLKGSLSDFDKPEHQRLHDAIQNALTWLGHPWWRRSPRESN
jgi:hypothetical protein